MKAPGLETPGLETPGLQTLVHENGFTTTTSTRQMVKQLVRWFNYRDAAAMGGCVHEHGALMMALQFQISKFRVLCSAAAVAGVLLLGADGAMSPAWSQSAPFSALGGSWSGSGTIHKSSGSTERIRCRSTYEPAGANLALRMRCASDSYSIDLTASVAYQGGAISGSWQEATRGLGGSISGQSSGGGSHVHAVASGPVTSNITVRTQGNHQSVSIVTPGAEVPEVVVSQEKH
jgi:hypothetical protein